MSRTVLHLVSLLTFRGILSEESKEVGLGKRYVLTEYVEQAMGEASKMAPMPGIFPLARVWLLLAGV